jgi:hypothetical protein
MHVHALYMQEGSIIHARGEQNNAKHWGYTTRLCESHAQRARPIGAWRHGWDGAGRRGGAENAQGRAGGCGGGGGTASGSRHEAASNAASTADALWI